ncbi:MAG: hypothetical protein ACKOAR_09245 [Bacteroidota bacterium]
MRIALPLFFLLMLTQVVAQDPLRYSGARIRGMGDASVAVRDASPWSPNPASPQSLDGVLHQFTVQQPFSLEGSTSVGAGLILPVKNWLATAGIHRFGDGFHSQSAIMSGFSTEVANTVAGIRMEYHQVRTEGFQTQGMLSWSVGSVTRLGKKITVGVAASGFAQAPLNGTRQRIVPYLMAGIALRPSEAVLVAVDVHKRPDRPPVTLVGIEYRPVRTIWARMGVGVRPQHLSAGMGFRFWRLTIDQAVRFSEPMGWSVQATAGYVVQSEGKRNSS